MSEYVLEKGRPADASGRLGKEIRVYDFLDRLGIDYERVDHPALMTMEACESVDKMLDTRICKNLFLRNAQRTQFYLLLMPGDKKFKTAVLSKQIGSARLSFAEPEFMLDMLDITPGSVSVDERQGQTRAPANRRRRAERACLRLPPLHQHQQPALCYKRFNPSDSARIERNLYDSETVS